MATMPSRQGIQFYKLINSWTRVIFFGRQEYIDSSLLIQKLVAKVLHLSPGTDVMILKIFSQKKIAKKLAFLTQNKARL
jgi:hypothetical protein